MPAMFKKTDPGYDSYRISYHRVSPLVALTMLVITVAVMLGMFWFTQMVRSRLRQYNLRIMTTYARLWTLTISRNIEGPELSILFEEVIQKADFPMVYTTVEGEPIYWRNLPIAENDTTRKARSMIKQWVRNEGKKFPTVPVRIPGSDKVLAYIYFGESPVVKWLRLMPFAQGIVIMILFVFATLTYRRVRRYEQENIWLGMAKEAAHQLGTPTSSLLGWLQLMREEVAERNYEELAKIIDEMEKDIQNLSRIVVRFGQIGSVPELSPLDPLSLVKEIIAYLRDRLPQLSHNIQLVEHYEATPMARGNKLLLSWALENLIKNSIEAIGQRNGVIWVATRQSLDGHEIHIIVSDNGKGISSSMWKKIYEPGFTTKKRGWGIGLTLAKRIVEDYHHGRLFLLESRPFERTTFVIALPAIEQ